MELCKKCGRPIDYVGNFCPKCGQKLYEVCLVCWQHDRQPYNCGQDSCQICQIKKVPVSVGAPDKDGKQKYHLKYNRKGDKNQMLNYQTLKVSAKSNIRAVAGAVAAAVRENGFVKVHAIGAGAVNQAVKAIAIARGFVAPQGIDLVCVPAFTDIMIDDKERTTIKLIVEPRR